MKVVFVGTSEFGIPALEAISKKHDIELVISQPDRPKGRGRKLLPTPVKEKAHELGLKVLQPENIKEALPILKDIEMDVLVVVSYGQIIPKEILELPKVGPLNIHPSLLPKYRGAAPIQRALMNGEKVTGVTIMWMNERLDAGDIFLQRELPIDPEDNYGTLHHKLSLLSAEMILEALELLEKGEMKRLRQDEALSTYAKPISKEETLINWSDPALSINNKIRALSPKPGAQALLSGTRYKIYKAKVSEQEGEPGEILLKDIKKGILRVACGEGSLDILEIQPEGKKVMDVASFLRGYGHKL
ncbi:methionyl-tRNA formyltransferase [Thermosulfidibacter takaii ABI70S6]|uniref:Methionyl-tRNA formyltransferase n=1 Tax=Thermosulfidibacter takaii (strain DSM 17441 / JCM 13301 / NBRC 103674 / ABI70S6) TaxID=1298851 RepID=A0A0S3QTM7_THET7|nr:methionyl-tRNA formyltransferase [Thermosulfidibacter takaii]BAT71655.1 methionyl-tRNA formyltransferase [Thermosulfidibacter takaii ABI70S6]